MKKITLMLALVGGLLFTARAQVVGQKYLGRDILTFWPTLVGIDQNSVYLYTGTDVICQNCPPAAVTPVTPPVTPNNGSVTQVNNNVNPEIEKLRLEIETQKLELDRLRLQSDISYQDKQVKLAEKQLKLQKTATALNFITGAAGATGQLLTGVAGMQGKLGTNVFTNTNVFDTPPVQPGGPWTGPTTTVPNNTPVVQPNNGGPWTGSTTIPANDPIWTGTQVSNPVYTNTGGPQMGNTCPAGYVSINGQCIKL
jgi:hypothetical protein